VPLQYSAMLRPSVEANHVQSCQSGASPFFQGGAPSTRRPQGCDLKPVIAELQAAGVTSLRGIAAALNERGVPTVAESGRWYHAQVGRLLARLAVSTTLPP
jgi:hypothetical protein